MCYEHRIWKWRVTFYIYSYTVFRCRKKPHNIFGFGPTAVMRLQCAPARQSRCFSLSLSIRPVSATTTYTYIVVIYRHDLRTRIFLFFKLISCYSFYGGAHVSHFVFGITVVGRFLGSPTYPCVYLLHFSYNARKRFIRTTPKRNTDITARKKR